MKLRKETTTDIAKDYRGKTRIYIITCNNDQVDFMVNEMTKKGSSFGWWSDNNNFSCHCEMGDYENETEIWFDMPVDEDSKEDGFRSLYVEVKRSLK